MRTFRLNFLEREFLRTIINETLNVVQMQDRKKCCEYARCAIVGDKNMLVRCLDLSCWQKYKLQGTFFSNDC